MATTLSTESLTVTTIERTWRTQIESCLDADYVLTAHRELVRKAGATVLSKDQNVGVVTRALSSVLDYEHTCQDGTVIKPSHVAEALAAWIEAWRVEDQTPPEEPIP